MRLMIQAATQQLYSAMLAAVPRRPEAGEPALDRPARDLTRDRGAVSLEQVLWFIAVGVSVAVVATILWTQVIDTAEETDNIIPPTTP
jgi:type VI protein secretion system component VasF